MNILETQLTNVISSRSSQDQILWNIAGLFAATNAILLAGLYPNYEELNNSIPGLIISIVGFFSSLVWMLLQRRALQHVIYFERLRSLLEAKLEIENGFSIGPDRNTDLRERVLSRGPRARKVIEYFTVGVFIFWIINLALFIFSYLCSN